MIRSWVSLPTAFGIKSELLTWRRRPRKISPRLAESHSFASKPSPAGQPPASKLPLPFRFCTYSSLCLELSALDLPWPAPHPPHHSVDTYTLSLQRGHC